MIRTMYYNSDDRMPFAREFINCLGFFIAQKLELTSNKGWIFGKPGRGFQRINVACPRSVLNEALERLCRVMTDEILC